MRSSCGDIDFTFDDLSRSCDFKLIESKPRVSYCVIDTLVLLFI
jgi:hypothetical protein